MAINFSNIIPFVLSKRFFLIIALAVLALLTLTQGTYIIIVLLLMGLVILSKIIETPLPSSVSLDLSLFTLVVIQFTHGIYLALPAAIISYVIGAVVKGYILNRFAVENFLFPPIGYILTSVFLLYYISPDIFTIGIWATIFYASLMTLLYGIVYRFPIVSTIVYWITILLFNYFIFKTFGAAVVGLLS